jgi:hypothetical protein
MRKYLLAAACLLFVTSAASGQCLLTLQTEVLEPGVVGQPYNFQIEAVSGTPPYKFEVYQDMIPAGYHLTPSGRLIGKSDQELDTTVWVTVTDAAGCHLTQAYTFIVQP